MAVTEDRLALEAGEGAATLQTPRGLATVGTSLFVAGDAMVLFGLVAAYYAIRAQSFKWPPVGLGTYLPSMVAVTIVMTAVTVQWAVWAIRRNDQRTTLNALAFTIFLSVAVLNGQWYELAHLKFDVGAHGYGTFVYLLVGFHMANVIAGIIALVVVLGRTFGGEFNADDHESLTAAAIFWQFANVAGLVTFGVLFLHP